MARNSWMEDWYARRNWHVRRDLRFLGDNERLFCDWEDAQPDGWPQASDDMRYRPVYTRWHTAGVEKHKVYTDEEEKKLHAAQEQERLRQLRHQHDPEVFNLWDSSPDDGSS